MFTALSVAATVFAVVGDPTPADDDAHDFAFSNTTPALPTAEITDETRQARQGAPEILYVNFDGGVLQTGCGNDPHNDCSTLAHLFDGYVGPFDGNFSQRVNILQETRKDLADFGVTTVIERPPDSVDYTMVIYGDLGPQSFAGIAPYIDCEDGRRGDTSFTQGFTSSNTGSTVILQEAAHTWGLEHVDAPFDILNPFKSAGQQSFQDECFKIVSNTDLDPTSGSCNQIHQKFCETGWQNSYREMLLLFGPSTPDVQPPTLDIVSPEDGSTHVLPTTITLLGEVTDNLHPQYYQVQIWDNGEPVYDQTTTGLDLLLVNPPEGDHEMRVVITEDAGGMAEDTVRFTILPEGSELPEDDEEDPDEIDEPEGVESCGVARPSSGGLPMLVLVVLAGVRRRRR